MSKRRRRIFGALAAVAVLLIGVLMLFDWNWLKGPIESQVAGRLGRPFRIHGDLDVELSLQPKIIVESAELGNAPWGSDAPMAKIDRVEVTVDLLKLVQGEIVLPEVRIAKPDLLLETRPDGPPNWQFGEAEERSPGPPALPRIDRLEVSDASIRYHDLGSGRNLTAGLTRIAGRTDPDLKLNAHWKGARRAARSRDHRCGACPARERRRALSGIARPQVRPERSPRRSEPRSLPGSAGDPREVRL